MNLEALFEDLPAAVTVTDADGTLIAMNARSRETFAADGGGALIGRSVFDCHPEPARTATRELHRRREPNHYTIVKGGRRKMVHQLPWFRGSSFAGFVEITIPVPDVLPSFDRDAKR